MDVFILGSYGMSTTIMLLRHGQTVWNVEERMQGQKDSPLTALGIEQGRAAGERLAQVHIDRVFVSSLGRTLATYALLKPSLSPAVVVHITDVLVERSFGEGEGCTMAELIERFPEEMKVWKSSRATARIPGGETYAEVEKRVVEFLEEVRSLHRGETLLCITHGAVCRMVLMHYAQMAREPWPSLIVPNTAVLTLVFEDDGRVALDASEMVMR